MITVGGPAKVEKPSKWARHLQRLKAIGDAPGVRVMAYLEEGTSEVAIRLAKKWPGAKNVVIFGEDAIISVLSAAADAFQPFHAEGRHVVFREACICLGRMPVSVFEELERALRAPGYSLDQPESHTKKPDLNFIPD